MSKVSDIGEGWFKLAMTEFRVLRRSEMGKMRFDICNSCDNLTKLNTCKHCGCYMPAKVLVNNATCPDNKWPLQ